MTKRTIPTMILVLAAATAAASEEPSPRRGGYILLGADLQGTHLHVTEDGQPDRSPAGWVGGGQVGLGLHVAPRVDVYFLLESLGSDPRFNVMGLGATWYPRGWRWAGGDLFLEGRWSRPSVTGKFLRTGLPGVGGGLRPRPGRRRRLEPGAVPQPGRRGHRDPAPRGERPRHRRRPQERGRRGGPRPPERTGGKGHRRLAPVPAQGQQGPVGRGTLRLRRRAVHRRRDGLGPPHGHP